MYQASMTYQVNVELNVPPCVKVQLLKTPMVESNKTNYIGVFEYFFVFTPYLAI